MSTPFFKPEGPIYPAGTPCICEKETGCTNKVGEDHFCEVAPSRVMCYPCARKLPVVVSLRFLPG